MREIKFRAFDEATKQHWVPKPKGVIYFDIVHVPDFIANTHNENGEWKRRFTVEQFTGLLDCHGVEIYEGDICEVNFHDGVKDLMRVEYLGCTFQLLGNGFWSLTSTNVKIKVIGNIHQHTHLLEK